MRISPRWTRSCRTRPITPRSPQPRSSIIKLDSQTRATTAAQQLITNETRFAIGIDPHCCRRRREYPLSTEPILALHRIRSLPMERILNFVQVTVDTRAADYALTPVVGAVFGILNAKAVAGVSSAVCGVVPFFVCNPAEPTGNTNTQYPVGGLSPGTGVMMAQGGTQWGPGNFGFLGSTGKWREWNPPWPRVKFTFWDMPGHSKRNDGDGQCVLNQCVTLSTCGLISIPATPPRARVDPALHRRT